MGGASMKKIGWFLALSWGYVMEIYHGSSTQSRRIRGKMLVSKTRYQWWILWVSHQRSDGETMGYHQQIDLGLSEN